MHMADALLSPAVATTMYATSVAAAGYSLSKIKKYDFSEKLPVMGVMSAFVFAGQMINFTIPGTGSSGHLCGGVMLSALLGPQAGLLSMIAVLLIQCFLFADGGIMALGANIWNMAFYGCFIGYYLIYRPIIKSKISNMKVKLTLASVAACIITLQMGAFSVCLETTASGITELPLGTFALFMQPIHLAIGLVEGLITAAVLNFVYSTRPSLLIMEENSESKFSTGKVIIILGIATLIIGGVGSLFASGNPDGLEWSLFGNEEAGYSANMGLDEEDYGITGEAASANIKAAKIQESTALLPDYAFKNSPDNPAGTSFSGIIGSIAVFVLATLLCVVGKMFRKGKSVS